MNVKAQRFSLVAVAMFFLVTLIVLSASASTTISTNIQTDGTLSVTGLSTFLGGATTTTLTLLNGEIISNATDGVIQLGGIASTTSLTLLNGETITNATDGTITFGTTNTVLVGTASSSAIRVGDEASASTINGLVFGYCTAPSVNVAATSSATLLCASATGVVASDRIFVQATSSLPGNFAVTAASSTASAIIQIRVYNMATSTPSYAADTGINSFNFWVVRD